MTKLPLLSAVIFLLLAAIAVADIRTVTITSDTSSYLFLERFVFTSTGHVNVSVGHVNVDSTAITAVDPSRLGFMLISEKYLPQLQLETTKNESFCELDYDPLIPLFTLQELPHAPPDSTFSASRAVKTPTGYHLVFINCAPRFTAVTMTVRSELYSLGAADSRNYLTAALTGVPSLFTFFSAAYFSFLGFWIYLCVVSDKAFLRRKLDILMAILLLTKAISLVSAAADWRDLSLTGTAHSWHVMFNLFQSVNVDLLFAVIFLVLAGGSFLRPELLKEDSGFLAGLILFQTLANAVSHSINDWAAITSLMAFLFLNAVCILIFFVIAQTNLKNKFFPEFLGFVVVYLFLIRHYLFFFVQNNAFGDESLWWMIAMEEIVGLIFYVVMFCNFSPAKRSEYAKSASLDAESASVDEESGTLIK